MEEMREKRDEIINTIFHGDNYRLDIFFTGTGLNRLRKRRVTDRRGIK